MNETVFTSTNILAVSPAIALTLTGFVIIGISLLSRQVNRWIMLLIAFAGLAVSFYLTFSLWNRGVSGFDNFVSADNFALTFNAIFLIGAMLSIFISFNRYENNYLLYPEFFAIILFATVGMMLMAGSTNLVVLFLGLETLSICLYVLVAIKRTEAYSLEAAFKYFLLGAFASGFLLYGIAFLYGSAGSLDLKQIAGSIRSAGAFNDPLVILGGLLIIVGLGFKVAMFPFHMWAPDVYQGAPTPITAFMSTGSKAAGFAAMLRVLFSAANGSVSDWVVILSVLAVLTMFLGNIAAIVQSNIKRMLAYSSIAHAGYVLIGIVAWSETGAASVIFYLLIYTFMNIGAFAVVTAMSNADREFLEISDFRGMASRRPALAIVMAIFMFSLAGLPPTAGFVGKFYLFSAAVKSGHIPLAIFGVISSMISLYYYLGVVVAMFMRESEEVGQTYGRQPILSLSLFFAVGGTLLLGLFPSWLIDEFQRVVSSII